MRLLGLVLTLVWLYGLFRYLVPSGDPAALAALDLRAIAPTLALALVPLLLVWLLLSQARLGRRLRRLELVLRGQGEAISALARLPEAVTMLESRRPDMLLAAEEPEAAPREEMSRVALPVSPRREDDLLAPFSGEEGGNHRPRPSARLSPARYLALERRAAGELEDICRRLAGRLVPEPARERAERHRGRGEREVIFEQVAHALRDRRRMPEGEELAVLFARYRAVYEDLAEKAEASDASGDSARRVMESALGQVYRRICAAQDVRVESA